MASRVKYALPAHRFFYGCAGFIVNFVVPAYIYAATKNIALALCFLLIKYSSSAIIVLLIKNLTRKKPLVLIFTYAFAFFAASIALIYLKFSYPAILLIALLLACSEIFYNTTLNIIFAATIPDSRATVIQMPFAAGLVLVSIVEFAVKLPKVPLFAIIVLGWVFLIISFIPILFAKNKIIALNQKMLDEEIKKPYKDLKRDFFHISLGLFNGIAFEVLPLYLIINQGEFVFSLALFITFEVARLIFIKIGDLFHKKGWYNFAMALCPSLLATFLILSVIFKGQNAAYFIYGAVVVLFPVNFIPKFSSYNATIKSERRIHYNQTRREFFLAFAKTLAPLTFLIFNSLDPVIYLGAAAAIGMFIFSFNFPSRKSPPQNIA